MSEEEKNQELNIKPYTFSADTQINSSDTNEIILDKFTKMYFEFEAFYTLLFDIILEKGVDHPDVLTIQEYIDSQVIQNLNIFYVQRDNVYQIHNSNPGSCIIDVQIVIQYLKSTDMNQYAEVSNRILKEVSDIPFSFTLAVGAGTYQPQFLTPDTEYLGKINKNFQYNYILCVDPHEQQFGENQTLKNSYRLNRVNKTPFVEKTERWLKLLLAVENPVLEHINESLFSLEVVTSDNKHTKIFFMNGWFFDFNFFDIQSILQKSSFSIFNCSLNNVASCPDILLNKPIFDYFKLVVSSMGFSWKDEGTHPMLKNQNQTWIFYVERYKQSGGTYEGLVKGVQSFVLQKTRNFRILQDLFPTFFFLSPSEQFWGQLGGRRRKINHTRRRKLKRSKKTRRH